MSDALFSILFFLPIAILAIILTPFSRGSIESKRAHLIHRAYKESLEDDETSE